MQMKKMISKHCCLCRYVWATRMIQQFLFRYWFLKVPKNDHHDRMMHRTLLNLWGRTVPISTLGVGFAQLICTCKSGWSLGLRGMLGLGNLFGNPKSPHVCLHFICSCASCCLELRPQAVGNWWRGHTSGLIGLNSMTRGNHDQGCLWMARSSYKFTENHWLTIVHS